MDTLFIFVSLGQVFAPLTIAYALAALGLTVHFGYTGLLNFGQAGFMAVGGYFFAMTASLLDWPFVASLAMAALGAALFALLLGVPTLRLKADYLSIVTIAAAEIIRLVVRSSELTPITGGPTGINGAGKNFYALNPLPADLKLSFGPITYNSNDIWIRLFGIGLVAVCTVLVWLLMRSPWGRVIKGIREDEDAVRALGKNVFAFKMQSLVLGGVLAGLGVTIAIIPTSLQPDNYGTQATFFLWTIMLLGGATRILGPLVGSIIFWVVISLTEGLISVGIDAGILPITAVQSGQIRFMLVGLALMLLVVFRPQGILGKKKEAFFSA